MRAAATSEPANPFYDELRGKAVSPGASSAACYTTYQE